MVSEREPTKRSLTRGLVPLLQGVIGFVAGCFLWTLLALFLPAIGGHWMFNAVVVGPGIAVAVAIHLKARSFAVFGWAVLAIVMESFTFLVLVHVY
ncbi:hypothetical protein [Rhodococcus opacus]|uniref:hypothetical protein n=1 Tax=Rhodococcus opacus TaxID=37919 RepID=UPI0029498C86|nr:hypothetical protein [Rhodococcus opacus]MDV6245282.1 hypothetical protein [Rhodococcus opacus]